jgi:hypothetical protein
LGRGFADGAGLAGLDEAVDPDGEDDCCGVSGVFVDNDLSNLLPKQDMTPSMEVNDRKRNGRKLNGTRMTPQTIFQSKMPQPGMSASMLSANKTTSATHAARSSRENKMLTAMRALLPNETKARSANVMRELSTSRHFASSFAV